MKTRYQLYLEYLESDEWKLIKVPARKLIDNFICRGCGMTEAQSLEIFGQRLDIHHRPDTYHLIPNESVEDHLTTLCRDCHESITVSYKKRQNAENAENAVKVRPHKSSPKERIVVAGEEPIQLKAHKSVFFERF